MTDLRNINETDFDKARNLEEKIKFLLNYAVLAPSTHNTQPWLFKIEKNTCEIRFDEYLRLPEADPLGRDFFISLGCAGENLKAAAKYFGIFENLEVLPERGVVLRFYFKENFNSKGESLQPVVDAIPKRVNSRGLFSDEKIESGFWNELKNLNDDDLLEVKIFAEKKDILKIAELTAQGMEMAHKKTSFRKEMSHWLNSSYSRRKEGMPGYSLGVPGPLSIFVPYIVRFFNLGRFLGRKNIDGISSAAGIVLISSSSDKPETWVRTGLLAERMLLYSTSRGFKTSIYVAAIEMGELYREVQKIAGSLSRPQFLFALGKMSGHQKPNLRHEPKEKIIS